MQMNSHGETKWAEAQPLYAKAERLFESEHQPSKAPYAQVSQAPPNESVSVPGTILRLTADLQNPEAEDEETRLRILTIRGMLQTNYAAAQARATWQQVGELAIKRSSCTIPLLYPAWQDHLVWILGAAALAHILHNLAVWIFLQSQNRPAQRPRDNLTVQRQDSDTAPRDSSDREPKVALSSASTHSQPLER